MAFIRSALLYLVVALSAVILFFPLILVVGFSLKAAVGIERFWARLCAKAGHWICGIRYEVIGRENLPNSPCVFLAKHQSAWETLTFMGLLNPSCFVLKRSLLRIPIVGWAMYLSKHIPIDRSQGLKALKQVIAHGKDRLQRGISIIIFPEGTRVKPGTHPKFHKGGITLAKGTAAPIVPVAVNSGHCWPKNRFIKRPGKITVVIGQPIDPSTSSANEINQKVYEWIRGQMEQLEANITSQQQ